MKGQTIPLHFKVLGIPINLNVSLSSLRGVMEAVTGETEGQYLAPVNLDDVAGTATPSVTASTNTGTPLGR